ADFWKGKRSKCRRTPKRRSKATKRLAPPTAVRSGRSKAASTWQEKGVTGDELFTLKVLLSWVVGVLTQTTTSQIRSTFPFSKPTCQRTRLRNLGLCTMKLK